jgi:3-deoxy-D-manno-octulosonate 8-phosphate phosphatase (KDO 8-P phosphatase)
MISKKSIDKLKNIKVLAMDVDGTLTDSKVYYSKSGEELKAFSIRDGMGIELLHRANLKAAIITSETSPIVKARADKLKIESVILGSRDKTKSLKELAENLQLKTENIAYIGDDVNDEHVMKIAGFSACPNDAVEIIKKSVDYICLNNGGHGAVREFIELILKSQNKSITLPISW